MIIEVGDEALEHYGKKGMKWGVTSVPKRGMNFKPQAKGPSTMRVNREDRERHRLEKRVMKFANKNPKTSGVLTILGREHTIMRGAEFVKRVNKKPLYYDRVALYNQDRPRDKYMRIVDFTGKHKRISRTVTLVG